MYLYICVSKLLFIYSSSIHILFIRKFTFYDYYYYCFSTANLSFRNSLQQKNQANAYFFCVLKNNPNLNLFLKRLHFRINSLQFYCCFSFFKSSYYYYFVRCCCLFHYFFYEQDEESYAENKRILTEILRKERKEKKNYK